jgi:hypothetical protein
VADTTTDAAAGARDEGVADSAGATWQALRGALFERVHLLTLEARLAGLTLVQLLMYAVLVALLAVTAWLALVACIVVALASAGLHWAVALFLGVIVNLAAAAWFMRSMVVLFGRLDLKATLRRLQGHAP